MPSLQRIADDAVAAGIPGVVAVIARGDDVELVTSGAQAAGGPPVTPQTVFRLASITKPIAGALAMAAIERGMLRLDDPAERWLPELGGIRVLRMPTGPLDDTVPLARPITVEHILTCTAGIGFVGDFGSPSFGAQVDRLGQGSDVRDRPAADEFLRRVGELPLAHQPGEGWTYNAGMDVAGILLARASGRPLAELLDELITAPLGMADTGFRIDGSQVARTATAYRRAPDDGGVEPVDTPEQLRDEPAVLDSAAGGLVSTADDLLRFWRMLAGRGAADGIRVLTPESVARMTSPHATAEPENPFLDGQAWGIGAAVDVDAREAWNAVGRYGWIGSWGTASVPAAARHDRHLAVSARVREPGRHADRRRLPRRGGPPRRRRPLRSLSEGAQRPRRNAAPPPVVERRSAAPPGR